MGGGDLNLKKSWHPSTMKNMEKVWKAEQQDTQEKKRIAELKREIAMERDKEEMKAFAMTQGVIEKKDNKKLDWMYKGPETVNREDYLLGRKIDKQFEKMVESEKDKDQNKSAKNHVEHECIPPSLRFFSGNEEVDLGRKTQEDPLYTLRKKEMETRSKLLDNPVRLKELKKLIAQNTKLPKGDEKKKKTEKKLDVLIEKKYKRLKGQIDNEDLIKILNKRKMKKSKRRDRSSSSSSEEDVKKGKRKSKKKRKQSRSASSSSSSEEEINKHKKRRKRSRSASSSSSSEEEINKHKKGRKRSRSTSSSSSNDEIKRKRRISKNRNDERKPYDKKNHYKTKSRDDIGKIHNKNRRDKSHDRLSKNGDDKPRFTNYGLMRPDGSRISPSKSSHNNEIKKNTVPTKQRWIPPQKHKLSEEEKEKRRQEMLANASWRDKERKKNLKEQAEKEKNEATTEKAFDKEFIQKHLALAAEKETVASRIKSNINHIQRYKTSMDTNFAKR